jgi:hypothetical protein
LGGVRKIAEQMKWKHDLNRGRLKDQFSDLNRKRHYILKRPTYLGYDKIRQIGKAGKYLPL